MTCKKLKSSGDLHNKTSMVCASSQRGKGQESAGGPEESKRKTFPIIRAEDFAFSLSRKNTFSEMTDPGKERVEHCLALKVRKDRII